MDADTCRLVGRGAPKGMEISKAKQRRTREMMENAATYSDVEFQVGMDATPFMALKAMYARSSEVFSKMFFESGFRETQAGRQVVQILDVQPVAFEQLHRWVYDMPVDLPAELVFEVLAVARKYMVEDLDLHCRQVIATTARTVDGALALYASGYMDHLEAWPEALLDRVKSFGPQVLASPAVALLPLEAFAELVRNPNIGVVSEEAIFKAARTWAAMAEKRVEDPGAAWSQVIKAEVVRFDLMEPRAFAEQVVIPGLLGQEAALQLFVEMSTRPGPPREVSLAGRLRSVLCEARAEDALAAVEPLIVLCDQDSYPRTLARCLVEKAIADYDHCEDWVCMWSELWGALRAKNLRDACVRAIVDYCQNLFEDSPKPDALVHVWTCPEDTLGLVRILCRLNYMRKLALSPLVRVLEVLVTMAEEDVQALCAPVPAAQDLVSYLLEASARWCHLASLKAFPDLQRRLMKVTGEVE